MSYLVSTELLNVLINCVITSFKWHRFCICNKGMFSVPRALKFKEGNICLFVRFTVVTLSVEIADYGSIRGLKILWRNKKFCCQSYTGINTKPWASIHLIKLSLETIFFCVVRSPLYVMEIWKCLSKFHGYLYLLFTSEGKELLHSY